MSLTLIGLLVVAVIVYHFTPKKAEDPERPAPKPRLIAADGADPNWRHRFHANTESPAEVAFLNAMIDGFGLAPKHGALFSNSMRLDLQVQQGSYRADFIVDRWLVIEIDGAAWHSSDVAKANDRSRDAYFERLGYTVLRIAAKTALYQPREAIDNVRAAVALGMRQMPAAAQLVQKSGFQRLADTGSFLGKALNEVASKSRRLQEEQLALAPARNAFAFEKKLIEQAIDAAERQFEIEAYLDTPEKRERFERNRANLKQRLVQSGTQSKHPRSSMTVPCFPKELGDNRDYSQETMAGFSQLSAERARYMGDVKSRLSADRKTHIAVCDFLEQQGCDPYGMGLRPRLWMPGLQLDKL